MKLPHLPGELAVDLEKRQAIEDCAVKYIAVTGPDMLTGTMVGARNAGAIAVFDLDADHANGVLDAVALKTGKPKSVLIVQDILACELLETQTGVQPASPVAAGMALVPSDPAAYVAHLTALRAAKAGLIALGYTVVDVA